MKFLTFTRKQRNVLLGLASTFLFACGGTQTPTEAIPEQIEAEAESYVVNFRDRNIDLEPYVQGFPYSSFQVDLEHGHLLYVEETPSGNWMRYLSLPPTGTVDLTEGRQVGEIDWSTRSFWGAEYHPQSDRFLIISDDANEERINGFWLDPTTGSLQRATDNDYTYAISLSPDGSTIAYIARNGMEEPFNSCLHIRDIENGEDREIICDQGSEEARFSWTEIVFEESSDEKSVIVMMQYNMDRNQTGLARIHTDREDPTFEPLLEPTVLRYNVWTSQEMVNSSGMLYVSAENGFDNLYWLDFTTNEIEQVSNFHEDIASVSVIRETPMLVATILTRPHESELQVIDIMSGEVRFTEQIPLNMAAYDNHENNLVFRATSISTPFAMERAIISLDEQENVSFERSSLAGISDDLAEQIVHCEVERVTFPTFDLLEDGSQRMLHGFLMTPSDPLSDEERLVRITSFYGGSNYFSTSSQIMCEAGIATFSPAPRGSWGFGAQFAAANDGDLGGDEIVDIIYAAQYLENTHNYRPEQIGVYGGSHGGYATMRALTFPPETNDRNAHYDFGFGMSHAGFSDIVSFYEACNIPDWVLLEAGDPATDADRLHDRSPLAHADLLQAPLLLTHGTQDNRVPFTESEQFAEAAEAAGNSSVTFVPFEGQGHGIDGLENILLYYTTNFAFLNEVIQGNID